MDSNTLRQKFLDFFESKGHTIVPSSSLVPKDDPTVLFTSAGMNQFKDNFLGRVKTLKRAASCQRCLRTADLENVGKTAGHHTFFEMLGNFSFGDYFKKEAITWAWEFLTKVLLIEEKNLWCSVYEEDDESYKIWKDIIKMPENKIIKLGQKQNFWPSNAPSEGPNGPCGPCSEIFFDQGESFGCGRKDCSPACDCGRFVEVWNLVFTQFDRRDGGILEPLSNKNIDTGMGLERLASVMQNVSTNFETDLFKPIIKEITNHQSPITNYQLTNAISDHIRAAVFAICDGVMPSNEERGYVVRMLIRRSSNLADKIGIKETFLYKLVPIISRTMKVPYPELDARRENIAEVILAEEKRYKETIKNASLMLNDEISALKQKGLKKLSKESVFKFYDTYGLPIEAIEDISKEEGVDIDREGFQELLKKQKDSSRKSSGLSQVIFAETLSSLVKSLKAKTEFTGYARYEDAGCIKAIIVNDKLNREIASGQTGYVITDKSPFYGEQGGQTGDTGILEKAGVKCKILDTKLIENTILHLVQTDNCALKVEDEVLLKVDTERRKKIAIHHSATHILQAVLREVLGKHVEQSGSLVTDEFFRFDFSHFKDLSNREIARIEDLVNIHIRNSLNVTTEIMELEEAKAKGAIALFGEKYGKLVRVVSIGNISKELCGGTHVDLTGEIGIFKITSESAIGANMRRIEAVVGESALKRLRNMEDSLIRLSEVLKTPQDELLNQVEKLIKSQKELQKKIGVLNSQLARYEANEMLKEAKEIKNIQLFIRNLKGRDPDFLRTICDIIKEKSKRSVVILGSSTASGAAFVVSVSKELNKEGVDAVNLAKEIAKITGGTGGGRPDLAQAGGKNISKIDEALSNAEEIIKGII